MDDGFYRLTFFIAFRLWFLGCSGKLEMGIWHWIDVLGLCGASNRLFHG